MANYTHFTAASMVIQGKCCALAACIMFNYTDRKSDIERERATDRAINTLQPAGWFKMLLLVYRCLHQLAPAYLPDLITPYNPARSLRSANSRDKSLPLIVCRLMYKKAIFLL